MSNRLKTPSTTKTKTVQTPTNPSGLPLVTLLDEALLFLDRVRRMLEVNGLSTTETENAQRVIRQVLRANHAHRPPSA